MEALKEWKLAVAPSAPSEPPSYRSDPPVPPIELEDDADQKPASNNGPVNKPDVIVPPTTAALSNVGPPLLSKGSPSVSSAVKASSEFLGSSFESSSSAVLSKGDASDGSVKNSPKT